MSKIPLIGIGTWQLQGKECEKTIRTALDLGYRHIDTADVYGNHEAIGLSIKSHPREEIYLTTKLSIDDLLPDDVLKAVPRFLKELDTDYLDLLLIHWPNPKVNLVKTLETMLAFKNEGIVHSIGVSNFNSALLETLTPFEFPIATNQVELHPYLQRKSLVTTCKNLNIPITAYRPLAKGAFKNDITLNTIGQAYNKSASQIALRWLIQQDIIAIPKAGSFDHLKENLAIFDFTLSNSEMEEIRKLDRGQRFCAPKDFPILEG